MKRTHVSYLEDIRSAATKAMNFVAGLTFEQFAADEKTAFAVVRALEIIGEAAKRVPPEVRDQHANIPWRSMAGIRDKLIHDYVSVNLEIVWKTIQEDLPGLVPLMEAAIANPTGKPRDSGNRPTG